MINTTPRIDPSIKLTIRERIVQQIMTNIRNMSPENGNSVSWLKVQRDPLDDNYSRPETIMGNIVSVHDNNERYTYEAGCVLCTLQLQVDYVYKVKLGEAGTSKLESMRGDLVKTLTSQQQLLEDGTGKRLTIRVHQITSSKNVDSVRDTFITGFIEFEVQYRHKQTDPHKLISEA